MQVDPTEDLPWSMGQAGKHPRDGKSRKHTESHWTMTLYKAQSIVYVSWSGRSRLSITNSSKKALKV